MECRQCGSALERPGDACLVCHERNADAVVLECDRDRATLTILYEDAVVGETTLTTVPETGTEGVIERRNYASSIADEVRRKRPKAVYATGDRSVVRAVRGHLRFPFYRVDGDDPVAAALGEGDEREFDVVEASPAEKIGGSHSTLIGGRQGMSAVQTVAEHPHVKKVIPGPIDASGTGSRSGLRAKVTRADDGGNLRLLLRDGASVQENRIVTTAWSRETGERIRADLNDALEDE